MCITSCFSSKLERQLFGWTWGASGGRSKRRCCQSAGLLAALVLAGALNLMGQDATRLPVSSVLASADDGNVAANTVDGSLSTLWSASGDGQWIRYDLGSSTTIGSIKIAWYKGDLRRTSFDVQTSGTGTSWSTVFSG